MNNTDKNKNHIYKNDVKHVTYYKQSSVENKNVKPPVKPKETKKE